MYVVEKYWKDQISQSNVFESVEFQSTGKNLTILFTYRFYFDQGKISNPAYSKYGLRYAQ